MNENQKAQIKKRQARMRSLLGRDTYDKLTRNLEKLKVKAESKIWLDSSTPSALLFTAFTWGYSDEGNYFWREVYRDLQEAEWVKPEEVEDLFRMFCHHAVGYEVLEERDLESSDKKYLCVSTKDIFELLR